MDITPIQWQDVNARRRDWARLWAEPSTKEIRLYLFRWRLLPPSPLRQPFRSHFFNPGLCSCHSQGRAGSERQVVMHGGQELHELTSTLHRAVSSRHRPWVLKPLDQHNRQEINILIEISILTHDSFLYWKIKPDNDKPWGNIIFNLLSDVCNGVLFYISH